MSLTLGSGPLGTSPAGRFNAALAFPGRPLLLDPVPYRVRAIADGETVLDTERAALLHEHGHLPVFYAPLEDFRADLLEPSGTSTHCPFKGDASYLHLRLPGRRLDDAIWRYAEPIASAAWLAPLAALRFDAADRWLCEDADVIGHPRDPYHRIDVLPTSRQVSISLHGVVLAATSRALMLCETALPRRLYIPAEDVREALLVPSATVTTCAYKGHASYRSVRGDGFEEADLLWTYEDPAPEVGAIRGHWCFFDERVDVDVDGVRQARPRTPWSPPETG